MGNCLKTQLKESVNNDNLLLFNKIKLNVKAINNATLEQRYIHIENSGSSESLITCTGNGYLFIGQDESSTHYSSYSLSAGSNIGFYLANDNYSIVIDNKENISIIYNSQTNYENSCVSCNLENLSLATIVSFDYSDNTGSLSSFSNNLVSLRLRGDFGNITGDTNSLKTNLLQSLDLADSYIHMDFDGTGLSKQTSLVSVTSSNNISGDLINFVAGQYDNGRLSCAKTELKVTGNVRSLKLNGKLIDTDYSAYICWDNRNQIYVYDNKNNIIVCFGYSDSEISAKTSSGGDWYGCTVTKYD